jgi:hypothetical protein
MILTRQSGSRCEASATAGLAWDDADGHIARIQQAAMAVAALPHELNRCARERGPGL